MLSVNCECEPGGLLYAIEASKGPLVCNIAQFVLRLELLLITSLYFLESSNGI